MNRARIPVLCLTTLPWLVYPLSGNAQEKKPDAAAQEHEAATLSSRPTAAEISKKETIASALLRQIEYQVYEVRSAAEAMPEEKYPYRPSVSVFADAQPSYGPPVLRTFAEQVKHVACSNFAFAAELDGQKPPDACDKGGPARQKRERSFSST